jgi:hypothetical protein
MHSGQMDLPRRIGLRRVQVTPKCAFAFQPTRAGMIMEPAHDR